MKKWLISLLCLAGSVGVSAQERLLEEYLENGRLQAGQEVVRLALEKAPQDHCLRLQLGLAHFLVASEKLTQDLYRRGLRQSPLGQMLPFLRLPLPENPQPLAATYPSLRQMIERYQEGLLETAALLSQIPDDWTGKVPLRLGRVHFDIDQNGTVTQQEAIWKMVSRVYGVDLPEKKARQFGMRLDVGDVRWLEGYCHLLCALTDLILAYDTEKLFTHCGHLFFQKTDSPYQQLGRDELLDAVTFVHLLSFPLGEPERSKSAYHHLEQVIALSRRSWKCILAETDNDFEWIPSPSQRCVVPDWKVNAAMVRDWHLFLDEAESLLAGKTLLPFWRPVDEDFGIHLQRAMLEPRPFDLVLLVRGDAVTPYLQKGKVVDPQVWSRLGRTFGQRFWGFALWFN